MKKFKIILLGMFLVAFTSFIQAQGPGDPPDTGGGNPGGNPVGGGAPIGGGLLILIGLGAAYGGKKVYFINKSEDN